MELDSWVKSLSEVEFCDYVFGKPFVRNHKGFSFKYNKFNKALKERLLKNYVINVKFEYYLNRINNSNENINKEDIYDVKTTSLKKIFA